MQTQPSPGIVDHVRDDVPRYSDNRDGGDNNHRGQAPENQYRAVAYSMLAALLRSPPEQEVLERVTGLAEVVEDKDDFAIAMSMLGLSARAASPVELDDEFHALFIGIGRGELVPYGSWYLTGFLMEKPLGVLREDLAAIGYQRSDGNREPEDHVAALCEVMALMINDGHSLDHQGRFFDRHIASWFGPFFMDLGEAKSAVFYRSVARFGKAFFEFEKQYLAMGV
ncbi:MAG: molecular chaperone TorD family protein [Thiotrichales bacterium]|nr:MAG: molecular chaperone TorD family protein [Thiotrichales bacterium]